MHVSMHVLGLCACVEVREGGGGGGRYHIVDTQKYAGAGIYPGRGIYSILHCSIQLCTYDTENTRICDRDTPTQLLAHTKRDYV